MSQAASDIHVPGRIRLLGVLVIAVVVLAPAALGAYPEWARGVVNAVTLTASAPLLAAGVVSRDSVATAILARFWLPATLFTLLLTFFFVQTVNIGASPLRHEAWDLLATIGGGSDGYISVQPDKTFARAIGFAAYGAWALVCIRVAMSRRATRMITRALVFAALVHATLALVWHFALPGQVLWLENWVHQDLTGFFFNRNHAGAFFGILLFAVLGEFTRSIANAPRAPISRRRPTWRTRLLTLADNLDGYRFMLLAAIGLLIVCIALAQSRAALGSIAVGVVVFALLTLGSRGDGHASAKRRWVALGTGFAIVGAIALLGYGVFFARFETEGLESGRWEIYGPVLDAIRDHLWLGVGFGGFEEAFHAYRPEGIGRIFRFAHSDYLEIAMEAGIVALVAFLAMVAMLAVAIVRSLRASPPGSRDGHVVALAVLAQLATHCVVEFNMAIPAIVLLAIWIICRPLGFAMREGPATHRTI